MLSRTRRGFLLMVAACLLISACAGTEHRGPETSVITHILVKAGNRTQGKLSIAEAKYTKRSMNIEEERWQVDLKIRNDAYITSECNVFLRVFDFRGEMLDEYLLFNDELPYESTVKYSDDVYIKREHLEHIVYAEYFYHCLKKGVLK